MNGHAMSNNGDYRYRCKTKQPSEIMGTHENTQQKNGDQFQKYLPSSSRHTLHAREVNFVFQEPFIFTGYRLPNQPWRYYLYSAFWLHNETLNIWTHAIGCLCVLVRAVVLGLELNQFKDPRFMPVIGFTIGAFLSNLLSCLAHLLHSKSPKHHYFLFFMDYAGITYYNLGNGIASMYSCSHPHMYAQLEAVYLPVVVTLCWLAFLGCVLARIHFKGHFDVRRKVSMVLVLGMTAGFIAWPMAGRYLDCMQEEGCSLSSLHHISIVFVFFFLDALSFSAHAPECLWPGRFDIWGHGHQLFHMLVMLTHQLQLHALHVDLVHLERGDHVTSLDTLSLLAAYLSLILATVLTLVWVRSAVDRKLEESLSDCDHPCGKIH